MCSGQSFRWMPSDGLSLAHSKGHGTLNGTGIGVASTLPLNAACLDVVAAFEFG